MFHNTNGSLGTIHIDGKKKVKLGVVSSWTKPFYKAQPQLLFDKKKPISQGSFATKYNFYNDDISPKCLRIGTNLEEAKVEALFGPYSKNGYRYSWSEDEKLIAHVKNYQMITHQRTQVPITHMINKAKARGFV